MGARTTVEICHTATANHFKYFPPREVLYTKWEFDTYPEDIKDIVRPPYEVWEFSCILAASKSF